MVIFLGSSTSIYEVDIAIGFIPNLYMQGLTDLRMLQEIKLNKIFLLLLLLLLLL